MGYLYLHGPISIPSRVEKLVELWDRLQLEKPIKLLVYFSLEADDTEYRLSSLQKVLVQVIAT